MAALWQMEMTLLSAVKTLDEIGTKANLIVGHLEKEKTEQERGRINLRLYYQTEHRFQNLVLETNMQVQRLLCRLDCSCSTEK